MCVLRHDASSTSPPSHCPSANSSGVRTGGGGGSAATGHDPVSYSKEMLRCVVNAYASTNGGARAATGARAVVVALSRKLRSHGWYSRPRWPAVWNTTRRRCRTDVAANSKTCYTQHRVAKGVLVVSWECSTRY